MKLKIHNIRAYRRHAPTGRAYAADWREYHGKTRIYIDVADESVWDNLLNRRSRPHLEYRKLLPQILEELGLAADTKVRWSQHAGCSMCPCSPGFVIQTPYPVVRCDAQGNLCDPGDGFPADVWVKIYGEEHDVTDEDRARVASQVMNCELVTL